MTSRTTGSSPTSAPNCSAAVDESEPSCAEGSRAGARGVKACLLIPLALMLVITGRWKLTLLTYEHCLIVKKDLFTSLLFNSLKTAVYV